jgi:RNA polymerase sigma factor (sigma-70 family)
VGSVQLAEDAVADATLRALETWPRDGVPDQPRAWLTLTARRRAIDLLRRENRRAVKEAEAMALLEPDGALPPDSVIADDLLRLVFTCCHPALALDAQVALALRTLCGLTTPEVARALLVPEATMTKRLTRARQKIARAGIPYRVPADAELPGRLAGVTAVVYLVFNEGYDASGGDDAVRRDLTEQALRLGRLLHELMPDEPSVTGLLALMLLQDSRRDARLDAAGDVVLLADQDRARWRAPLIEEGMLLVGEGLRRTAGTPDPYVVQASIAACHALAPSWDRTRWDVVVSWYDVLLTVHDTPVVRLNRAVAVGERDGAQAGLDAVEALGEGLGALADYPPGQVARGELLHRLGRDDEARAAWRAAIALEPNGSVRRYLDRRITCLDSPAAD